MTWSNYDQKEVALDDVESMDQKKRAVLTFLEKLDPGLVVDVAANTGWFARLAASKGNRVIAFDIDDLAVGRMYDQAKRQQLLILPLKMNFVWPTGNHGMGLVYTDAYQRLGGDVVMALAILHHLARNQGVRFEFFARSVHRLARRAVIVEFIPKEDVHVSKWPLAQQSWYTLEHFIDVMNAYFPQVEIVDSHPAPRKMLLFTR